MVKLVTLTKKTLQCY